jgi:hypothetical protein
LIQSQISSLLTFSSNQASLDEVTESFGDGNRETRVSGAKAPAAQSPSTALPAKMPVTPESLDKFLEETENEREDHHLVKKNIGICPW